MIEKNAEEVVDVIVENRLRRDKFAYNNLKDKCIIAINQMTTKLESSSIVEVDEQDLLGLSSVTEDLRLLGYKFAYIEVEDSSGDVIRRKLRISVEHLL